MKPRPPLVFLATWLLVALALGASGRLTALRPPAPQLVLVALTALLIVLERRAAWLRAWIESLDVRALVALHLTRFVGFAFLALERRGELPASFALSAGWGDIAVAALAAILLAVRLDPVRGRRVMLAWNILAFLELLHVVLGAALHAWEDPASMAAMLRLPMSLLITFLVPILLASHVWIFRALRAGPQRRGGA